MQSADMKEYHSEYFPFAIKEVAKKYQNQSLLNYSLFPFKSPGSTVDELRIILSFSFCIYSSILSQQTSVLFTNVQHTNASDSFRTTYWTELIWLCYLNVLNVSMQCLEWSKSLIVITLWLDALPLAD